MGHDWSVLLNNLSLDVGLDMFSASSGMPFASQVVMRCETGYENEWGAMAGVEGRELFLFASGQGGVKAAHPNAVSSRC